MNSEIVDRYNSLFKLLSIPIEAMDATRTRIVYKQKCKTITKGFAIAKLQRKGILFLDTLHGENSPYKNNYTRYPIKGGEIIKGAIVWFHGNTATVSGLAEKRKRIVIAIRVQGLSFDIEVDPRKIDIGSDVTSKAVEYQPNLDCSDAEKELESVRKRLNTTTAELEECRNERDAALSKTPPIDAEGLPEDVVEKLPEIQTAVVEENIQETIVDLETAHKTGNTQTVQEKRLHELVEELSKLAPQQTISATNSVAATAFQAEPQPKQSIATRIRQLQDKLLSAKVQTDNVDASDFLHQREEMRQKRIAADNEVGRIHHTFNKVDSGFTPPKFIRQNGRMFELEDVASSGSEDESWYLTATYLPAQDPAAINSVQIAQVEKLLTDKLPDTVSIHSNNRGVTTYTCNDKRVESVAHLFKIIGTYLEKFNTTEWDDRSGINTYENVPTRNLLEYLLGKLQTTYIS